METIWLPYLTLPLGRGGSGRISIDRDFYLYVLSVESTNNEGIPLSRAAYQHCVLLE